MGNKDDFEGNLSFFLHFTHVKKSKTKGLSYRYGLGLSREYLGIYPLLTLKDANISEIDSVIIGEVNNWEYQLLLPISISYEFPNLFKQGYGLRLTAGIENRLRVHRIATESYLVSNYSFEDNLGDFFEDEKLTNLVNEKYSNFIRPYAMQANIGLEFLPPELISGGFKFINLIIHPFGKGQKLSRQFGVMVYINIPLFNLKKSRFALKQKTT